MSAQQINTFAKAYNSRNADTFNLIKEGRIVLRESSRIEDAVFDHTSGKVSTKFVGENEPLLVDGIVSATGQNLSLPQGIDTEHMEFRMVLVGPKNHERLVALDAYKRGTDEPLGIRIEGAQMVKAKNLVNPTDRLRVEELLVEQSTAESVPADARGVPDQTNIDIPLANANATPKRGGTR